MENKTLKNCHNLLFHSLPLTLLKRTQTAHAWFNTTVTNPNLLQNLKLFSQDRVVLGVLLAVDGGKKDSEYWVSKHLNKINHTLPKHKIGHFEWQYLWAVDGGKKDSKYWVSKHLNKINHTLPKHKICHFEWQDTPMSPDCVPSYIVSTWPLSLESGDMQGYKVWIANGSEVHGIPNSKHVQWLETLQGHETFWNKK